MVVAGAGRASRRPRQAGRAGAREPPPLWGKQHSVKVLALLLFSIRGIF